MTDLPPHPDTLDETDEVADAIFARILSPESTDPEIVRLVRAITVSLPVNDAPREEAPSAEPDAPVATATDPSETPGAVRQSDGDTIGATDTDGDTLQVDYVERFCEGHGWEPCLLIRVNEEVHLMPGQFIAQFSEWLESRVARAARLLRGDK